MNSNRGLFGWLGLEFYHTLLFFLVVGCVQGLPWCTMTKNKKKRVEPVLHSTLNFHHYEEFVNPCTAVLLRPRPLLTVCFLHRT